MMTNHDDTNGNHDNEEIKDHEDMVGQDRKRKNRHDYLDGNVMSGGGEISRKRSNGQDELDVNADTVNEDEESHDHLDLKLGPTTSPEELVEAAIVVRAVPVRPARLNHVQPLPVRMPLRLAASHPLYGAHSPAAPPPLVFQSPPSPRQVCSPEATLSRPPRGRRNPAQVPREGKSETVTPPFPWATNQRATVHTMRHLLAIGVRTISGAVQCKRCERQDEISFDLKQKFGEIGRFVYENRVRMHDRAPAAWMNPALPACKACKHDNSLKPVIADKKKSINWLFLLLGQLLGCCTLEQLKYFCKHTKNHRTGAKDRVLYLTYLALCKQVDPTGPFDRL